jgi:CheY-like chemotaxis protein
MGTQVIVVDDDPIVGNLTLELIRDAGLTVMLVVDSLKAQDIIRREKPELVVLDILMPGLDGMALLHKLKADPATAAIRAVVLSAKSFESEKMRSQRFGAELFIEKPYDVDTFGRRVVDLLRGGGVDPATLPPAPPTAQLSGRLKISVWGSRSPSPASSATVTRYGRHTSCVSVELPNQLVVFDAGSGIVLLGNEIMKRRRFSEVWLFLTHFHADHVEGLSSFACARDASMTLHVGGVSEPDKTLESSVIAALEHGPSKQPPACRIELYEMLEQTYEISPGVRMSAFYANHPGTTLGYMLQAEDRKVVYCPDSELYGEAATSLQDYDEKLGLLIRGADVLIHDGRYSVEDYRVHHNEGHSSFLTTVDFAGNNGVKQLILVHQDDRYTDEELDRTLAAAQARVAEKGYELVVHMGQEGLGLGV